MSNHLQQTVVNHSKSKYFRISTEYLWIDIEVGIHSKYARKCTFILICEFILAEWIRPEYSRLWWTQRAYKLWAHSFVKRTFWKWAHKGVRAHNKMSLHPNHELVMSLWNEPQTTKYCIRKIMHKTCYPRLTPIIISIICLSRKPTHAIYKYV